MSKVLERAGIEIEWSDEWTSCCDCGKLVRTSGDSYSWTRSFTEYDGHVSCHECLESDPEGHLESLEGNPDTANTLSINPGEHDYVCLGEFERGFHHGQDGDPGLIAKVLEEQEYSRFLFNIDGVGQFDARFSVWLHESEGDDLDQELLMNRLQSEGNGPSVSEALKRGLEEASREMSQLFGEGIKHAQVHGDGSATVKLVSPHDFIDGKA